MPSHYILFQLVSYFKTLTRHLKFHFLFTSYLLLCHFILSRLTHWKVYSFVTFIEKNEILYIGKKTQLLLDDDVVRFVFIYHLFIILLFNY